MHLVIATRGIKNDVDRWISDLQAIYMKKKMPKSEPEKQGWVQFAVRPIQLWDFVFPREAMQEILATVRPNPLWENQKNMKKYVNAMRKIMHLKKIPKIKPGTLKKIMFEPTNIQRLGIGIKEDVDNKDGEEML